MKKLFVLILCAIIEIPKEIVKKIDVKKEMEEWVEGHGIYLYPPFSPAFFHMLIYNTSAPFRFALFPYFYEYIQKIKMENDSQPFMYKVLFWNLINSTHIAIGKVIKKEINVKNRDYETYFSKINVKLIKKLKGKFEKEIITLWIHLTGEEEGIIVDPPIFQPVFIGDTLLLFMQNIPQSEYYSAKYGNNINYVPGEFFTTGLLSGIYRIFKIDKEKRIFGNQEDGLNLPYENVMKFLNVFIPICEELEKEAKKYKFPLSIEEYAKFMKEKGYNYPLEEKDYEKIRKKLEEKYKIEEKIPTKAKM